MPVCPGRSRCAYALSAPKNNVTTNANMNSILCIYINYNGLLFQVQFTDRFCRHKVGVLYAERLVTGTTLFVNLHYQQLVIRQCQLGQY